MHRVHLPLDPLPLVRTSSVERSSVGAGTITFQTSFGKVCCQRLRNGGVGMPDLGRHWLTERLAYLG